MSYPNNYPAHSSFYRQQEYVNQQELNFQRELYDKKWI